MSDKTCDFCGAADKSVIDNRTIEVKPFDMTGRVFCSIEHFRKFYETRQDLAKSDLHSTQEIKSIEEHEVAWCAPFVNEPNRLWSDNKTSLEMLERRIDDLKRLQEEYRAREIIVRKHVMKIVGNEDAAKTERYRKYGVNSDAERKKQVLTTIQKEIVRYLKMNLSEQKIIDVICAISSYSEEQVKTEIQNLKGTI